VRSNPASAWRLPYRFISPSAMSMRTSLVVYVVHVYAVYVYTVDS
jgi:hypothetical protein